MDLYVIYSYGMYINVRLIRNINWLSVVGNAWKT